MGGCIVMLHKFLQMLWSCDSCALHHAETTPDIPYLYLCLMSKPKHEMEVDMAITVYCFHHSVISVKWCGD